MIFKRLYRFLSFQTVVLFMFFIQETSDNLCYDGTHAQMIFKNILEKVLRYLSLKLQI
jgi:hypothetical protein